MITAGPAPLTPVPMVVKMPPPIIVPRPMAMRSFAVSARLRMRPFAAISRSLSTLVVAKSREAKDIRGRFAGGQPPSPRRRFLMETDPYVRLSKRELYRNPWLAVEAHEIVHPNGTPGEHVLVVAPFPCAVVVEDGGALLFARQPRFGARRVVVEIVKGGREGSESALECAARELREELGVRARHWSPLGRLYEIPSIVNEPVDVFLASDTSPADGEQE